MNKVFISALITLLIAAGANSQDPPRPQGQPGERQGPPPMHDWTRGIDTNNDGKVDAAEFNAALNSTFSEIDRNANGMIDANEMPRTPHPGRPEMRPDGPPAGDRPQGPPPSRGEFAPDGPNPKMLPPFFFADRMDVETSTSRADFERIARGVFNEMDKDGDGVISREESRPPKRPENGLDRMTPPPPNGQFIAAELRFGDRLVKGQPFSAETVVEDTRRLYDGTSVKKSSHGAIYRDSSGRTRREQPLEMVGGVSISGADGKPTTLVFINDFGTGEQYFLDVNAKVARKHKLGGQPGGERPGPDDASTESLGKKTIEGVEVEGTRITFEIPAGQIGNDKPIPVVTENWFSNELQMMVYSRHTDPIAGEHIFKLTNIKRGEPSAELFTVPTGYRVEFPRSPRPPED